MIDVKKLNNTIDELENNAAAIARVAEFYNKLEKFKAELDVLHTAISDNDKLLKKTESDMRASIEILKSQLNKMPVELMALRTEIENDIGAIHQGIDKRLDAYAADQKSALETFLNQVKLLLSNQRSDIVFAIRNEGAQVQRGLENIVKEKYIDIQTILEKRLTDMEANHAKQNRYLFVGFALIGINIILVLAALWFLRQ